VPFKDAFDWFHIHDAPLTAMRRFMHK